MITKSKLSIPVGKLSADFKFNVFEDKYSDTSLSSIGEIPLINFFDFETSKSKQVTSLCFDKRTAFAVPT